MLIDNKGGFHREIRRERNQDHVGVSKLYLFPCVVHLVLQPHGHECHFDFSLFRKCSCRPIVLNVGHMNSQGYMPYLQGIHSKYLRSSSRLSLVFHVSAMYFLLA